MIEQFIACCIRNRFLVIACTVFGMGAAIYSLRNIKLDAIPDLSDVQVIVFTEWPGRAPTLVEDQVTYPIVSALAAAPKVRYARGQSFFGLSFVSIIFEDGTDMYWARSRVLEYLNQVRSQLPDEINPVLGPDATGVGWVYQYALVDRTGRHSLADLRTYQDWTLRYYLQNTPGVAEVASLGGYVNQYQVVLDPIRLEAHDLAVNQVIRNIRRSNNDVGGRLIEFGETEYMVRGLGYLKSLDDIEKIVIAVNDSGTPVLLRDIAEVRRGPDIRRGLLEMDGEGEAVGGIIVMRYGENALKTIEAVKEKLEAIKPALPPGVEIVVGYDRSDLILRAVDNLKNTLIEEMLIVSVVIIVFLLHFRSALVAIVALPLGVLFSFIPMYTIGITSNIMSLGGIAIAIGAMVDASVVFIENAHKWLNRWRKAKEQPGQDPELAALNRMEVITRSAQQVGKPLFASLLIIAVSFLPVFALEAQSGRLFKPLAYTKTFSMLFAALLAISLVPVLIVWFVRGKIPDEETNPLSRFIKILYEPLVKTALRFRWLVVLAGVIILMITWWPHKQVGSEFMPPLNEGSLLYMPTSPPGMSISEAREVLHRQNKIIKSFPEVERVYGKIGRARSATDPAPLSMVETTITLKPEREWREGMTFEKIKQQLSAELPYPGMPAIWWMPIQTRIEMLATGIRSQVGIKILGPDLEVIERLGIDIEKLLGQHPHTASAFSERVTGGYYVDFTVDRDAIARYGLMVEDVQDVIETAIGGKNIDTAIEGRARFPINVRYGRDFRDGVEELKRVLVSAPDGKLVTMGQLADIRLNTGPPMIRDENGQLAGFVFVDTKDTDLGSYVDEARRLIRENIDLPSGYYLEWGGQYQYLLSAREKLGWIIPFTLAIIFLILYLNFGSFAETAIVLLSIPFALVGGIWLLWILDYNYSVAVAVGFIALAGVAAETGVVMIVYLDEAWDSMKKKVDRPSTEDLKLAIMEGAVQRVRPKMMTVLTTIIALLPILWGHGTGADTMKRIAAPMVGGMVSSTILTLLIVPAIYAIWRNHEAVTVKPAAPLKKSKIRYWIIAGVILFVIAALGMFFAVLKKGFPEAGNFDALIHQLEDQNYQIRILGKRPDLTVGNNIIKVHVLDAASGIPVTVDTVDFRMIMEMPGMQMAADAQLTPDSDKPGFYTGPVRPGMGGEWIAHLRLTDDGKVFEESFTLVVEP